TFWLPGRPQGSPLLIHPTPALTMTMGVFMVRAGVGLGWEGTLAVALGLLSAPITITGRSRIAQHEEGDQAWRGDDTREKQGQLIGARIGLACQKGCCPGWQ